MPILISVGSSPSPAKNVIAVMREMEPLVHAQVAQAKGISFLVLRDRRTGQFIKRLTAGALRHHLKQGDPDQEVIEVWQKDPSTMAFKELMPYTIDLPVSQFELADAHSLGFLA